MLACLLSGIVLSGTDENMENRLKDRSRISIFSGAQSPHVELFECVGLQRVEISF